MDVMSPVAVGVELPGYWPTMVRRVSARLPKSGATREIAALDGLRALAVGLVVWHHVALMSQYAHVDTGSGFVAIAADNAFVGVFLFFVLSGFLLFLPHARALLAGQPMPPVRTFYARRVLRIVPGYAVAVVLVLLLQRSSLLLTAQPLDWGLLATLLFDWRPSAFDLSSQFNWVFWTLTIEWQFYLMLPFLARGLALVGGRARSRSFGWRLGGGLFVVVAVGLAIRILAAHTYYDLHQHFPALTPGWMGPFLTITFGYKGRYLEIFALGMALATLYAAFVESGRLRRHWGLALGTCALAGAAAGLVACTAWTAHDHRVPNTVAYTWVFAPDGRLWSILGEWCAGLSFALLLWAVLVGPRALRGIFASGPARFVGIISYSIYLWHLPIINALSPLVYAHPQGAYVRMALWTIAAVHVFCTGAYYLVERPFIKARRAAHTSAELRSMPLATPVDESLAEHSRAARYAVRT